MLDFFNELLNCFKYTVQAFFNDFQFDSGVSIGWILVTISVFGIIIAFFFGRLK